MKILLVCTKQRFGNKPSCGGRGSKVLADTLAHQVTMRGLADRLVVQRFPCLGSCEEGPNVRITGGALFHHVCTEQLEQILRCALDDAASEQQDD